MHVLGWLCWLVAGVALGLGAAYVASRYGSPFGSLRCLVVLLLMIAVAAFGIYLGGTLGFQLWPFAAEAKGGQG